MSMLQRTGVVFSALALLVGSSILAAQSTPPTPPTTPTPAVAAKPGAELKISLMDGSLLTGKLSISELSIETKFGPLKVPVEQLTAFMPGLQSHPKFQQTVNSLVNDLAADAFSDREKAQQALIKIGPDIRGELERQLKGAENEKAVRLQKIIEDFESGMDDASDKPRGWMNDDVIVTPGFTVVGRITTPGFTIAGSYGSLQIKMEDVREVRRETNEIDEIRKNVSINGDAIANRTFTNTGIKLAKGDQVIITAGGTIMMTPWGSNQTSTPDGSSNYGTVNSAQGIFSGTLIGRVGDSGQQIKVGSKLTWTADKPGVFYLGIACQSNYSGNSFPGSYDVKIRVVKKL